MVVNTYVKNMEPLSLPLDPLPVAFSFKEEGVLATHPLSCHPQRVLASEKMKENERKCKRDKKNKASPRSLVPIFNE